MPPVCVTQILIKNLKTDNLVPYYVLAYKEY